MGDANHSMWGHLPILLSANSKESVEYILQALWRIRHTGLDDADYQVFRDMLQLPSDSDLDSSVFPGLKTMALNMTNQNMDQTVPVAAINLKLQNDVGQDKDVKFQLAKDTMGMMLKSMYCIGDKMTEPDQNPGQENS